MVSWKNSARKAKEKLPFLTGLKKSHKKLGKAAILALKNQAALFDGTNLEASEI